MLIGSTIAMRGLAADFWTFLAAVLLNGSLLPLVVTSATKISRVWFPRRQLATVVLQQFIPNHWWESFLHNQTAWLIKAALLYGRRYMNLERVVIDVPFHLRM